MTVLRDLGIEFIGSPWAGILGALALVLITQVAIAWRENRRRVADSRMRFYVDLLDGLAEAYTLGCKGAGGADPAEVDRILVSSLGQAMVLGSDAVFEAVIECRTAILTALMEESPDVESLLESYTGVAYAVCCHVHGERVKRRSDSLRQGDSGR